MVLVQSGFPHAKEILRKLFAIWARALTNIRQPCPRPKKFGECLFKGCQIISMPRAPTYLRPALVGIYIQSMLNTKSEIQPTSS
jgi:hypothetical protein